MKELDTSLKYLYPVRDDEGRILKYKFDPPGSVSHLFKGKKKTWLPTDTIEVMVREVSNYLGLEYVWKNMDKKDYESGPNSTVESTINKYMKSKFHAKLAASTKYKRRYEMELLNDVTMRDGVLFTKMKIRKVSRRDVNYLYDYLIERKGVSLTNSIFSILSRIFSIACHEWNYIIKNPFTKFARIPTPEGSIIWTPEEVHLFYVLSRKFGKESVGLVARMCYELAQRPVDIRMLKKNDVVFKEDGTGEVNFTQQKTGVSLSLDISKQLAYDIKRWMMNRNKKYHLKSQKYLLVDEKSGMHFRTNTNTALKTKNILKSGNMRSELSLSYLRRSAATEMGDGGATENQIMAVTGHKSSVSVQRYVKPTKEQANQAQEKRQSNKKEGFKL